MVQRTVRRAICNFTVTTRTSLKRISGTLLLLSFFSPAVIPPLVSAQQTQQPTKNLDDLLKREVPSPVVLCIDDKPTGGGQPSAEAYANAAMNGFRSVLTLRTPKDGVDLTRERLVVEHNKLRYFNIRYYADFPQREQVDNFLKLARDPLNQPMLVNCAFAERVAPLMMMFRIVEQGWAEDKAVEEASRSGLASAKLRRFAKDYLAKRKKLGTQPAASLSAGDR